MKKFLYLSLIVIVSLGIYSCKRKSLPIEPGELGKEFIKENTLPRVLSVETFDGDRVLEDYDTTLADIQDIIFIYFSEPMDENSLLSSVQIRVIGGKGNQVPSGSWEYEKESNRLIYKLSPNVGYADSTKYEVIIRSSAKDLSGNPLDGNRNGIAEGNLDDYYR
ncbi:MAG: Ig-like domain-containing protein, partial [candidate division WOR-3 bacterium]